MMGVALIGLTYVYGYNMSIVHNTQRVRRWKQREQWLLHQVDREIEAAYGFVSDYNLSFKHSAMPIWLYHSRPTRIAFHDLTTRMKSPKNLRYLLGLNLKFIPNPSMNVPWTTFEKLILPLFDRDLRVKVFMAGVEEDPEIHTIQKCMLHRIGFHQTFLLR
jgi:hypothetical protein